MQNKELQKAMQAQYKMYRNSNAEVIKEQVVHLLLEGYGYNIEHLESNLDELVIAFYKTNKVVVKVISPQHPLNREKQDELAAKMTVKEAEWGILSNGQDYLLMSSRFEEVSSSNSNGTDEDRYEIIFKLNIYEKKDLAYMDYLSAESLFKTRVTEYFKHIAKFKALKYPGNSRNWLVYKGTIIPFFEYFIQENKKYVELSRITVDDFEGFLRHEMGKKKHKEIVSMATIDSKYSYIRSLFKTLNVKDSEFYEKKSKMLERFDAKEAKEYDDDILSTANIRKILAFYDGVRDSVRYKTIFLLTLAYGLGRATLVDLSVDQIEDKCLVIEGRKLPIPSKLWSYIQEVKATNEENGAGKYLFNTKYRGQYNQISEAQINYVFDILQEIDSNNPEWKKLNPAYIHYVLIKMLFKNNYPIEEIVYLTGADLTTIAKQISTEEIIQQVSSRNLNSKKLHPFVEFLGEF